MVENNGRPQARELAQATGLLGRVELSSVPPLLLSTEPGTSYAACHDEAVTLSELKRYIASKKRLDMEQVAAMAVSALPDHVNKLMPKLEKMLQTSCMWREEADFEAAEDDPHAERVAAISSKLRSQGLASPQSRLELIRMLMQVRRRRPKLNNTQRLQLPDVFLEMLELSPEERCSWQESFRRGQQSRIKDQNTIVVCKKTFAFLTAKLHRIQGPSDAVSQLNRAIDKLAQEVDFGGGRLQAMLASTGPLAVAFSFVALQRRRQLKVSDIGWTAFLEPGEGAELQQNTPDQPTSFEQALWNLAMNR